MSKRFYRRLVLVFAPCLIVSQGARVHADNFSWEPNPISNDWDHPANWAGTLNQFPDDNTDTASVSGFSGFLPQLTANRTIGALSLFNNNGMTTGDGVDNYSLLVQDNGGESGTVRIIGSRLVVYNSPAFNDLDTDHFENRGPYLSVVSGLQLRDGARVQVDDTFDNDNLGIIGGAGVLEFGGATNANNNGTITAMDGTLSLGATGAGYWDIDGSNEAGVLEARPNSTLAISPNWGFAYGFNGSILIEENGEVHIDEAWTLIGDATMDAGAGVATLSGGDVTITGTMTVVDGTARLAAATTVVPSGLIDLDASTQLQFDAPTTIQHPDSLPNSAAVTTLIVNDTVNIGSGSGNFDWDNQILGQGRTIVNVGGSLNLDVDNVDIVGNTHDGTITMNSGNIDVQSAAWFVDGSLNMNNTDGAIPVLSGVPVTVSGELNVGGNGRSEIQADTNFVPGVTVDIQNGAQLRLAGASNTLQGGTWSGAGTIELDADVTNVFDATTIDMPNGVVDLDGLFVDDLLFIQDQLTLNVASVDPEGNGIDDDVQITGSGRLNVQLTNPGSYRFDRDVTLQGGLGSVHFEGAPLQLAGTTTVSGESISNARVTVTGTVEIGNNSAFVLAGGSFGNPDVIDGNAVVNGPGRLVNAVDSGCALTTARTCRWRSVTQVVSASARHPGQRS